MRTIVSVLPEDLELEKLEFVNIEIETSDIIQIYPYTFLDYKAMKERTNDSPFLHMIPPLGSEVLHTGSLIFMKSFKCYYAKQTREQIEHVISFAKSHQ